MSANIVKRGFNKIKRLLKIRSVKYRFINPSAHLAPDVMVYNHDNLIMEENTNIDSGGIIMNMRAKFIMKKNSGAAIGLLVVTGNHMDIKGKLGKQITDQDKDNSTNPRQYDKDIIVEEDVWLGARATLLYGTHVKRGAIVGAGSVVRSTVPPYSIVIGNPAKVVGFRFSPEEIIEHEKEIYPENDRLNLKDLEKYYNKYFTKRIKDISKFINL